MKRRCRLLSVLMFFIGMTLIGNAQEGETNDNERYVGVTKGNQDAVVLGEPDLFSEDLKCILGINDEVTLLDSTEGDYVKIRTKCDGKVVEGWVKKIILRKERVEVGSGLASSIGAPATSTGSKGTIGYETPDLSGAKRDTVNPPWDQIDLVGYRMKPGLPVDLTPEKEGIPPWIYVGGGLVTGGVITYLITRDEDPDELTLVDDQFSVPCNTTRTLDVLANDLGEGLTIIGAEGPAGTTFTASALEVSGLIDDVSITYTVRDASDNTATAAVNVTVTYPSIAAVDDVYETDFEIPLTGNVLNNDIGEDLQVSVLSDPVAGQLVLSPDGSFTYQPQNGFSGQDQFQYSVTDRCSQEETATVTITVSDAPCEFNVTVESVPTHCGLADGTANVEVSPVGDYTFAWSDGSTDEDRTDLSEGTYSLSISDENDCETVIELPVGSLSPDYDLALSTSPATCIGGGEINLSVSTPSSGPMVISVQGSQETVEFTAAPGSMILVSEHMNVVPGDYSISVWDQEAGEDCAESVDITVPDETPPAIAMDDFYTTDAGESLSGNVLDNDQGLSLRVIDYTEPASGTLTLESDGSFEYQAASDPPEQVSFVYEIRDTCGQEDQAEVIIELSNCTFEVSFETTGAHCGLSDGSSSITIEPDGNYDISWSDGSTGLALEDVSAGDYDVTVVDTETDCSLEYSVTIEELPADYALDLSSSPGNCLGGGEVIITFENPGEGPLVIQVDGPEGMTEFTVPNGEDISLADHLNVVPGMYAISVWDQTAGKACSETAEITVQEETTAPVAVDDDYTTGPAQVLAENVLDNDEGLFLTVVDNTQPSRGELTMMADGSFQYVPDGAGGDPVSFEYFISDTCGQQDTGLVIIAFSTCEFTANFETTDASCGVGDGTAVITLDPIGLYEITWSDGTTGNVLEDVTAGTYSVTVEDTEQGCSLEFQTTIEETEADYFDNVTVIQPECGVAGDIILDLITPGNGPFLIEVTHPNGMNTYSQGSPGTFILSEFMSVVPGEYLIVVRDVSLPNNCVDEVSVMLVPSPMPQLFLEGIVPPSTEFSNDGAIILFIDPFTTPPFDVFLNGTQIGQISNQVFTIQNVSAGFYEIFVIDAEGCQSNTLAVEVFPESGLTSIESGWMFEVPPGISSPTKVEHPPLEPDRISMPTIAINYQQSINGMAHWAELRYGNTGLSGLPGNFHYELFNIKVGLQQSFELKDVRCRARLGYSYEHWNVLFDRDVWNENLWNPVLEGEINIPLLKKFRCYTRMTLEGIGNSELRFEGGVLFN